MGRGGAFDSLSLIRALACAGVIVVDLWRQIGPFTGHILKGKKPPICRSCAGEQGALMLGTER
jgi:hypothetical protein